MLVDTDAHYASGDADERYRVKPGLLRTFGWNVEMVLAKDWRENSSQVVARLEAALDPDGLVSDGLVSGGPVSDG